MEDNGRMNARLTDVVLDCVMPYIHDPKDRDAVSQVLLQLTSLRFLDRIRSLNKKKKKVTSLT